MIDCLRIENFKSISQMELHARKFNILSGTNSSGKSSVLQALLILAQNMDMEYGINGPLVSIGEFREIKNLNIGKDKIKIFAESGKDSIGVEIEEDSKISFYGNKTSVLAKKLCIRNNKLHYLSCNRIGSQDIYYKNRTTEKGVGLNGEYAIDFLEDNKGEPLEEKLCKEKDNYTLNAQVNYWMKYIIGANISVEGILGTDAVKARYSMTEGIISRPQNVGSGISYLVSIVVMCLGSEKNDILIIENPEIHLHPLSQSRLCEFLYFVANSGRQIFIETHSDHIFNAVRVGIANQKMEKGDIAVNFFRLGSDNCTRNYEIEIGRYGKIENPIPDMFDQFQIDLERMLGV